MAKENHNEIINGDFESTSNKEWIYSVTGNPVEVEEEIIEEKNSFVEIKTTESVFQRTNFLPNESGVIGLSVRGKLPVIVSVMEASSATPVTFWSEEVPGNNKEWKSVILKYSLGNKLGSDLCLHIQAKWDENSSTTVDIDNVTLQGYSGTSILNGDFESGGDHWIYSVSGSAVQTKDEIITRENHFARIHPTESIFQKYSFKSNESGTIRFKMRGKIGGKVSIMDALSVRENECWSYSFSNNNEDWHEYVSPFSLDTVRGNDLCLHFQADYDDNHGKNFDLDDVILILNK